MINQNKFKIYSITLLLLSLSFIQFGFSEEKNAQKDQPKLWYVSLGYGIALKNNIRKDNNYSGGQADVLFSHIPLVQVALGPVLLGAQGLSANFIGNREIAGYLNINRAGDRYYSSGMESRKDSWFFGAGLKFHKFNFLLVRDINGRSHGVKFTSQFIAMYPIAKNIFTRSSVGLECYDKSFAEYYYGVRSNEISTSRMEYHPNSYCLPTMSFFPGYKYNEEINVLVGASVKILSNAVHASPTIDGSWVETALIIGASSKF